VIDLLKGASVSVKKLFAASDCGRKDVVGVGSVLAPEGPLNNNMRLWGLVQRGFPAARKRLDGATYRFDGWTEGKTRRQSLTLRFPSERTDPRGPVFDVLTIGDDTSCRRSTQVYAPDDTNPWVSDFQSIEDAR
jgi:hypothetical protein